MLVTHFHSRPIISPACTFAVFWRWRCCLCGAQVFFYLGTSACRELGISSLHKLSLLYRGFVIFASAHICVWRLVCSCSAVLILGTAVHSLISTTQHRTHPLPISSSPLTLFIFLCVLGEFLMLFFETEVQSNLSILILNVWSQFHFMAFLLHPVFCCLLLKYSWQHF